MTIEGLTYETHIYDYLVFRTYTSNRVTDMGAREKAEGLYVEKPVCDKYRRQHFPGHPAGKADVLRLLAESRRASLGARQANSRQYLFSPFSLWPFLAAKLFYWQHLYKGNKGQ